MKRKYHKFKTTLKSRTPQVYFYLEKYKTIIKYFISGGTAALVDIVLLYFFTDILGIWYVGSAVLAFTFASYVSFYLQKFWTFRNNSLKEFYRQLSIYFLVNLLNLWLNTTIIYLLVDKLGVWYIFAQIITGLMLAIGTFLVNKFFIFRKARTVEVFCDIDDN